MRLVLQTWPAQQNHPGIIFIRWQAWAQIIREPEMALAQRHMHNMLH
jgi:hypothetical protein